MHARTSQTLRPACCASVMSVQLCCYSQADAGSPQLLLLFNSRTPYPFLSLHAYFERKQNLYLYISINSRTLSIVAPAWAMSEQTNKPKTRSQHERALSLSSFACYLFSFAFSACLCMCGSASGGAIEQKIGFQTRIPFLKLGFQTPRFGDNQ